MRHPSTRATLPAAQAVAERISSAIERFLYVESVSGIVLLAAAIAALVWANSSFAESYHQFWSVPWTLTVGAFSASWSLHFVVNDVLMTLFFLVVGMEIRRELHAGALADARVAALPLAAALGGIVVPAVLYLLISQDAALSAGWAIPTATDIAFAVGVLALLGKSVPAALRIFLLALAIIDDVAAVLIIATFYSGGLNTSGLFLVASAIALLVGMRVVGISRASFYIVPGAMLWGGLLMSGLHPTLAGVALGLITPVVSVPERHRSVAAARQALQDLDTHGEQPGHYEPSYLGASLKQFRMAERGLLAPIVRVQLSLHPWVAFLIMPLFALANAGVDLRSIATLGGDSRTLMTSVAGALIIGKPLGIVATSWIAMRFMGLRLPESVTWGGLWVVGCLGGIGFTMSIFISMLAFDSSTLLSAAKAGVLVASAASAIAALVLGRVLIGSRQAASAVPTK